MHCHLAVTNSRMAALMVPKMLTCANQLIQKSQSIHVPARGFFEIYFALQTHYNEETSRWCHDCVIVMKIWEKCCSCL